MGQIRTAIQRVRVGRRKTALTQTALTQKWSRKRKKHSHTFEEVCGAVVGHKKDECSS